MSIILPKSLKGFSVFVDGRGYAGRLSSGQLPKISIKTEAHRDGGMDMEVDLDMGMNAMEMDLGFDEYDPELFKLVGLLNGQLTGVTSTIVCNARGIIKELDPGSWTAGGSKAQLMLRMAPRYYRLTIDGEDLHEIDAENCIRIINGVDQLAARRQALGI